MPYKIAGQPGTWYEPGTRKGNATIAWRGQLPDGRWTEFVTDSANQSGAQAHLRRFLEQWHRDRPPAAGDQVALEAAAHHYKATLRADVDKIRVDRLVRWLGPELAVAAINQTHLSDAAGAFRRERALANRSPKARQKFPPPSAATVNREVTTPLRGLVHFCAAQQWRPLIVLKAVKPLAGELPSPPRPVARDADVDRLLGAIETTIAACRPTPAGRTKGADARRASLKALRALVTLVHERGYRISEWLRWDFETIDLQAASASILLSKPDRWVTFDLSPMAVAALAQVNPRPAGKVFPWHGRSAVYAAVDAVAPKGLKWRPHESRRAVVTAVIRATGSPVAAQQYVSHANLRTTLRYDRPEQVGPAVRSWRK